MISVGIRNISRYYMRVTHKFYVGSLRKELGQLKTGTSLGHSLRALQSAVVHGVTISDCLLFLTPRTTPRVVIHSITSVT